ncbi:cytochrome P450 [Mycena rebaudengoi]|nr:cytochrome P450 [Mycena rebaudengoi]
MAGSVLLIGSLCVAVAYLVFQVLRASFSKCKLSMIPSVGVPPGLFGFYIGSWHLIKNGRAMAEEGYAKYPGRVFKLPLGNRWIVIVNGREVLEQLRKARDDEVSVTDAGNDTLLLEYTMGHEQHHDAFQIPVIRSALTRNIAACYPTLRSEIVAAFEDLVPAKTDEWISVPAMDTVVQIVSRASNRLFIGLKCRDPEYIKITTKFAMNVLKDALFLNLVPRRLRSVAMHLFGSLEGATRNGMKHLAPIIQHRLDMDDKYGRDWPDEDRPNDLVTWLIDEINTTNTTHTSRRTVRTLTRTILNVNFGAIHTTTQSFLQTLYNLAAYPQYVDELRAEVEAIVQAEGWTKGAIGKMSKLDSFLKETARLMPGGAVTMGRMILKDYTLVDWYDGTCGDAGWRASPHGAHGRGKTDTSSYCLISYLAVLQKQYPNATEFDPFRFSRMREQAGEGIKHQMVTPSTDFLLFGLGRHACPGRFFAVNELKLMFAHILVTYDVKLRDGVRPADEWTCDHCECE